MEFNPCLKLTKPPTVTRKEMQFYDEEELQLLFKHLEYEDLTFKTAIYLLVLGGLRRGECLGLMWKLVNFKEKTNTIKNNLLKIRGKGVYLETPKTKKSLRTVTLPDVCFDLLKELKNQQEAMKDMFKGSWQDTDFVFKDEFGNYFNPSRLSRNWSSFMKKHNLKHIRLHDLRHTCATYLLSHNTPIATVSKKLGHSNIYTTLDVYTHAVDSDDVDASNLLNNMVLGCKNEKVSKKD